MKFIAPRRLLIPDKCKANIAKSTLGPLWLCISESGGYKVQPVPTPFSVALANINSSKLGGNNHKLMLLSLGKAISGPPAIRGNKKLPKPPIIAGITIKKIITRAWAVIILLYNWLSAIYWTPGPDSSNLINIEKAVPISPENNANMRYRIPISFALDEDNHLSFHSMYEDFFILTSLFKPLNLLIYTYIIYL